MDTDLKKLPDELPKYLRYDIFMSLLGILTLYFSFVNERIPVLLRVVIAAIGAGFFGWGALEMKANYEADKHISALEHEIKHMRLKRLREHLKKEIKKQKR